MVGNEHHRPAGFMENVALLESTGACNIQAVNSKKRARVEMSSQTHIRADRVRDTDKPSEVLLLKEALKSERDALQKLYIELEEERGASMTAANEAMAMITRLQEEKAAVLMEAHRYRRVAEERESHHQEAIGLLKEALLTKEDDVLALQDLLNAYRETLLRIESGQEGDQGYYLGEGRDKEELLLLEGPSATPSLHLDSNQAITGCWRTEDGHKGLECYDELQRLEHSNQVRHAGSSINFADHFHDHNGVHDEKRYEGLSEDDYDTDKWQPGICRKQGNFGVEGIFHERHMCQSDMWCEDHSEIENHKHSQEQCLENVSESIFARVKRLEERFENLRRNQALEYQMLNVACQSNAVIPDDLEPEEVTRPDWESTPNVLYNRKHGYCMEPERLAEVAVHGDRGEPEEVLKCLSFERVRTGFKNEDQKQRSLEPYEGTGLGSERRDSGMNLHRVNDERLTSAAVNDDGGEGVHDVYEVQYEIKRPFVHPPEQEHPIDNSGRHKCETGSMDTLILGILQEAAEDLKGGVMPVPSNHAQPEDCTAVDDKLSVEISLLDVKGVHTNLAEEDVRQLKGRLQALEGERGFMKEAIESLRKENKELKVLQELAQQLRDLKVDVRRKEAPGQQDPLPLFSFFKGILSFTGLQNLAATEGSRCFLRSSSRSTKQEQGGLLHILNKASKTPRSVCVTRERKVNFNST
eukprot:c24849_g2_i1 orf=696-2786(+)